MFVFLYSFREVFKGVVGLIKLKCLNIVEEGIENLVFDLDVFNGNMKGVRLKFRIMLFLMFMVILFFRF